MTTFTEVGTFHVVHCCACGMPFALSGDFYQRRMDDGKDWHCPSGHSQHFTDSAVRRLEKAVAAERAAKERAEAEARWQREQREHAQRRLSASRGVVTRIKNRVGNGVCPCCNRSFANLARHMSGEHPEWKGAETP